MHQSQLVNRSDFECLSTVFPSCGGEIKRTPSLSGGTITSPNINVNGSTLYGNNLHCQWTIRVNQGERAHLEFIDFDVETSTDCSADYLEVSEQSTGGTTKRFCGPFQPDSWTSTGNVVLLSLVTDGAIQSSGFKVSWRAMTNQGKKMQIRIGSQRRHRLLFPGSKHERFYSFEARLTIYLGEMEHTSLRDSKNLFDITLMVMIRAETNILKA